MKRHRMKRRPVLSSPSSLRHRTDPESPSGSLSLLGFSAQGRGRTPSEGLAFFSTFFAVEGVLVGKALEVRGFANSSAFPEKLVHPARSGQPFSPLACFLQEDAPNTAIDFCEFFFQSFFKVLLNRRHCQLV